MKKITSLLAWIPILTTLVFLSYVFRATVKLNHLPKPYLDDPKDLKFVFHHSLVSTLIILTFVCFIILILISIFYKLFKKDWPHEKNLLTFAVYLVFITLIITDPFNILKWYFD